MRPVIGSMTPGGLALDAKPTLLGMRDNLVKNEMNHY